MPVVTPSELLLRGLCACTRACVRACVCVRICLTHLLVVAFCPLSCFFPLLVGHGQPASLEGMLRRCRTWPSPLALAPSWSVLTACAEKAREVKRERDGERVVETEGGRERETERDRDKDRTDGRKSMSTNEHTHICMRAHAPLLACL